MALVTIVEPQSEPVALGEMKQYLRIGLDFTDDDALIAALIEAARRWCEVYTRRRFIYQTVRLEMDFFPGYIIGGVAGNAQHYAVGFMSGANAVLAGIRYAIQLPFPPVHHIAAFTYTDQNGSATPVVAGTDYVADLDSQPARLMPPFGKFWPVAQVIGNAVKVDFVTGYGANIAVGTTSGSNALTGYTFVKEDAGSPIKIAGAGASGADLQTVIAAVDDSGNATIAVNAGANTSGAATYLGKPVPPMICVAIKLLVSKWYECRMPADEEIPSAVKAVLGPYRDLRL